MESFQDIGFCSDDVWDDLCDIHESEVIAVLRAYIDASTRKESGLLSVAGYLFESGPVRRFRQEWRDTFGPERFSWADLIARSRPFKGLRGEEHNAEHDRLVAAGVSLLREYTIAGVISSCWMQDVENYGPTWIKGFAHAYSIAGHMAMVGIGKWARLNNYNGGIAYIIEAGDEGYDQLEHLLSYASKSQEVADAYQWNGHSTAPKTPHSPFHAPDLFAWEWGKYWTETVIQRKRPIRRSLASLLIDRLDCYTVMHLGGEPLLKFFEHINALGVEQLQRNADAAASVPVAELSEIILTSEQITRVGDHE
jgi:hypothetical protein